MAAKPISLDDVITEIERVFADHIQRPPIAHDVAAYNQAHAAFEHLKARLVSVFTGKPVSAPDPAEDQPEAAVEQSTADTKSKPTV